MTDNTTAFDEGHAAYHAGDSMDKNPHVDLELRDQWASGYLHADHHATPKTDTVPVEPVVVGGEG